MRFAIPIVATALALSAVAVMAAEEEATSTDAELHKLQRLKVEQRQLLADLHQELEALRKSENAATTSDQRKRRKQLEQLLAQIERRIAMEEDPRTKFVEPNRTSDDFTKYHERLMAAIEQAGIKDYPTRDGRSIYGQGRIRIVVRSDGTLEATEIAKSSGDSDLDKHVIGIVRRLQPFDAFTAEMSDQVDRLVIESKFRFFKN